MHSVHTHYSPAARTKHHAAPSLLTCCTAANWTAGCTAGCAARASSDQRGRLHGRHERGSRLLLLGSGSHWPHVSRKYMDVLAHVLSVLIHNIIQIRIIHNTRRFALYCATLIWVGEDGASAAMFRSGQSNFCLRPHMAIREAPTWFSSERRIDTRLGSSPCGDGPN